jgi:hypothetical protein
MAEEYKVLSESTQDPEDGSYVHKCGATVLAKTVYLSVRNPQMPLAGSGDVIRQVVPFCPDCGPMPPDHGTILETETPAAREEEMLRNMKSSD